ncbi:MAG: hypothetical protein Q8Q09_26720 [Deltaproteobacteria bacterium]|nr:hypothetical protein [Deltaproteobacteria bacterium]
MSADVVTVCLVPLRDRPRRSPEQLWDPLWELVWESIGLWRNPAAQALIGDYLEELLPDHRLRVMLVQSNTLHFIFSDFGGHYSRESALAARWFLMGLAASTEAICDVLDVGRDYAFPELLTLDQVLLAHGESDDPVRARVSAQRASIVRARDAVDRAEAQRVGGLVSDALYTHRFVSVTPSQALTVLAEDASLRDSVQRDLKRSRRQTSDLQRAMVALLSVEGPHAGLVTELLAHDVSIFAAQALSDREPSDVARASLWLDRALTCYRAPWLEAWQRVASLVEHPWASLSDEARYRLGEKHQEAIPLLGSAHAGDPQAQLLYRLPWLVDWVACVDRLRGSEIAECANETAESLLEYTKALCDALPGDALAAETHARMGAIARG